MIRALLVAALAAPLEGPLDGPVGPPAPPPAPVRYDAGFVGPRLDGLVRSAPGELWTLSSIPAPVRTETGGFGLSLDEALKPVRVEEDPARRDADSPLAPRLRMDRLAGLDDVVSELDLQLSRPPGSGWSVSYYATGCGDGVGFRLHAFPGFFPRCLP